MEGAPTQHSERISDRSEEYREIRERMRETVPDGAMIFGEAAIDDIDINRQIVKDIENDLLEETSEEKKEKLLDHKIFFEGCCKKRLSELKADIEDRSAINAIPFFETISTSPHIEKLVKDELPWIKEMSKYDEVTLFVCTINKDISDQLFEEMVRVYVNFWEKKQEEFHEKAPYMLAEFKEKTLQAIKENKLPITQELLEERMEDTRIYLADAMSIGDCTNGDYSVKEGVVRVAYRDNEEAQKKTVFHEMLHALSGRTVRLQGGDLDHQRNGLGFWVYNSKGNKSGKQFRWLNEAVTEEITIELSEIEPEDAAYPRERKYLQELYNQGVSKQLVYEAYFENYDADSQEKVPKWKELVHHIKDKYPEISDGKGSVEYLKKVEEEIKREKYQFIKEREGSN